MPLAPAARTLIDQLESGGGPALWEMSPDDARALSAVMGAMDDPPEVAAVEDRVIAGPAGDVPVRIYTPDAPAPRPVIAFFHGGGFVICSVDTHDGLARRLANATGAVVVSVVYPVIDAACDAPSYVENGEGYFLEASGMRWFWDHYLGPDGDGTHHHASPN